MEWRSGKNQMTDREPEKDGTQAHKICHNECWEWEKISFFLSFGRIHCMKEGKKETEGKRKGDVTDGEESMKKRRKGSRER